jgi:hypothetical protein
MNTDQKKLPKSPELPKLKNLLTTDQRGLPRIKKQIWIYLSDCRIRVHPRKSAVIFVFSLSAIFRNFGISGNPPNPCLSVVRFRHLL